jgi:hypothetical protein
MQYSLFRIFAGLLLLFLGRRLFWLFVGLLGFLAGFSFGARFFTQQTDWALLLIAFGCGLIGIFLALFLQRLAVAIAGFLAGGLFATTFVEVLGWNAAPFLPYLIGGVLGAILLSVLFDWALIFLSSVTGAMLLARSLPAEPFITMIAFVVLTLIGIFVQARFLSPARLRGSGRDVKA